MIPCFSHARSGECHYVERCEYCRYVTERATLAHERALAEGFRQAQEQAIEACKESQEDNARWFEDRMRELKPRFAKNPSGDYTP